jgi:hypothetical protein
VGKLVDAALVAPAGEVGVKEGGGAGLGHVAANQPCAQGKDVGVIMLTGQLGGKGIGDPRAAAGGIAVDRDRNADPRAADDNPALCRATGHGVGQSGAKLRIIDAFRPVGTEVHDLMSGVPQPGGKLILQDISGMVGGKGDAHRQDLGDAAGIRQWRA